MMSSPASEGFAPATVVDVLIPVAIDTAYSYRVPAHLVLAPGDVVVVPLGTRQTLGVVWDTRATGGDNLKSVTSREDWPPLREPLRRFIDWLAAWTLSPRGMVLRMAIRAPEFAGSEPVRVGMRRAGPPPARMTPARARVLAALDAAAILSKRALAEAAGCSTGVIDGLVDEGTIETVALPGDPLAPSPDPEAGALRLEGQQAEAAAALAAAVEARAFGVSLLEGVTGSGKTETYFEAVAAALRSGRQTLILLPEIALTAQFLDRFAERFGTRPAEWHSGVSPRRRARIWSGTASGDIRVVAGARSSLFLPFGDLGLIVVDEEHEAAYKQDDGVTYHARDMAVMRGRFEGAAVILASATPSLESRVNAETGRYAHLRLAARYGGRTLPSIAAIDLRRGGSAARALDRAAPRRSRDRNRRARRAGPAVLEPPRLRALDPVRLLRAPLHLCAMFGLARRTPVPRRPHVPSLRARRKKAETLPPLRRGRCARGLRPRRRAHRRRDRGAVPRRSVHGPVVRPAGWDRTAPQGTGGRGARGGRYRGRHAARGQGSQLPQADARRHHRRPMWASPTETRARRSGPSNSCSRSPGGRAAGPLLATPSSRPGSRTTPSCGRC